MIKADSGAKVKALFCAFTINFGTFFYLYSYAQPSQKTIKLDPPPPVEEEVNEVKPIEAEEFSVRTTKKSSSGKVWLFENLANTNIKVGKIILLKQDKEDIAAIRILKNYSGKFAAKVVLPMQPLKADSEYRAIKKLGDKIVALIKEREKRIEELDKIKTDEDLAQEVSPDDAELDRGIPKPQENLPDKKDGDDKTKEKPKAEPIFNKDGSEISQESIELQDEDEIYADIMAQDELPIEPYHHVLSAQYAILQNVDRDNKAASYTGLGGRYAYNVVNKPFFSRRTLQDLFSLEVGLFYYTIVGFQNLNDSVTVMPFIGTARYGLLLGDNFTLFGYAGFIKNNASADFDVSLLSTTNLALGAGTMIKIGPGWAARLDYGNDLFAIGLVLKF